MFRILFLFLLLSCSVHAQSIKDTSQKLTEIETNLTLEQKEKESIEGQKQSIEHELKTISKQTDKTIKSVKSIESDSAKLRGQLNELKITQAELTAKRQKIEKMVVPLLGNAMDIKSIPADLNLFLNNEADIQSQLTTHVALQSAAKSIKILLEQYQEAVEDLNKVEQTLETKQSSLESTLETLAKERESLAKQVKKQAALKDEVEKDLKKQSKNVADLQLKRESLSTLLDQLKREEIERKKARAKERTASASFTPKELLKKSKDTKSKRTLAHGLPASGFVVSDFGDIDPDSGLNAQGITIEGEPNGLVTSPKSGEVRYRGEFRSMGQMILIEHKNGDFSLLAGLSKIKVNEGDQIDKDAPIGTLSSSTNPLPRLYYELRRNGQKPVDPSSLF